MPLINKETVRHLLATLAAALSMLVLPASASAQPGGEPSQDELLDGCYYAKKQASCLALVEQAKREDNVHEYMHFTRRACDAQHAASCTLYGVMLQNIGAASDAEIGNYFYRGCAGNDSDGCAHALDYVWGKSNEDSIIKDGDKRMLVAERACANGESDGCGLVGKMLGDQGRWADAVPFARKACKIDKAHYSCTLIATYEGNARRKAENQRPEVRFTAADGDPVRDYAERTRDYAGSADYIVTQMPGGRSLYEDSPLGDLLGELVVAAGEKGLREFSEYAISNMVLKKYWSYNPPASLLVEAEYTRRQRMARKAADDEEERRERARSELARRQAGASAPYVGSAGPGAGSSANSVNSGKVCTESYLSGYGGGTVIRCK